MEEGHYFEAELGGIELEVGGGDVEEIACSHTGRDKPCPYRFTSVEPYGKAAASQMDKGD